MYRRQRTRREIAPFRAVPCRSQSSAQRPGGPVVGGSNPLAPTKSFSYQRVRRPPAPPPLPHASSGPLPSSQRGDRAGRPPPALQTREIRRVALGVENAN